MIIFSDHALLKLEQRKMEKELVITALKSPDLTKPSYGDRQIAYKRFGKLYLKVIYRKEGDNLIIITQHWTDKMK